MKYTGIAVVCLLLLALLPASCIMDDYAPKGTASVTMTFTTRATSNAGQDESSLLDKEQMKTLRVIVARKSDEILYNVKYDINPEETQKVIRFSELTVNETGEKFDFYAIANEAALGNGVSLEGTDIKLEDLKSHSVAEDFNAPQLSQLPQARYEEIEVKPQKDNAATMQLQFPVAKINLSFVNTTENDQSISDVELVNGTPDKAKLFYDGNMPAYVNVTGKSITFDDFDISATGASTPASSVRYVYPGETNKTYTISAQWNGKEYTLPLVLEGTDDPLTNLERDKQYNVTITLKGGGLTVSCKVQPWEEKSHEVQLSDKGTFEIGIPLVNIKQFEWNDKPYVATQYGEGAGAADRYATLTLRMTTPEGVKWQAHLDNPDFEFVGESEGVGVGENPQTPEEGVVTLRIRPVHTFSADERRTVNLFVTLGTKPNEHALFIADDNLWPDLCTEDGVNIPIVQVSSTEGDQIWKTEP